MPRSPPVALAVAAVSLALVVAVAALAPAPVQAAEARRGRTRGDPGRGEVVLDGAPARVRWNDGDSFRVEDGPRRGQRARLLGVNALETFGPVHRWGGWRGEELLAIARGSAALAASERWTCASVGRADRYGRLLVSCPDAARRLVEAGHAMVFAMDGPAEPWLLSAQRAAQAAGAGMWAKGVPPLIPTSAHAAGERGLRGRRAYDRVADTRTGAAASRRHDEVHAVCEDVCAGPPGARACLVYVPYERQHRRRPPCLDGP
jgi:endonuclease YncB( thermonuclease family)